MWLLRLLFVLLLLPASAVAAPPAPPLVAALPSTTFLGSPGFSPDGKTLAVSERNRVVLWEVATWKVRASHGWPGKRGTGTIAFSPDGRALAADDSYAVRLWQLPTGKSESLAPDLPQYGLVAAVAYSPTGKAFTFIRDATRDTIKVLALPEGRALADGLAGAGTLEHLVFSPDGKTLAAAFGKRYEGGTLESGEVRLWDAVGWQPRVTLRGHAAPVRSVAFSPDGNTLASAGSRDGTVLLWDPGTGKLRATWESCLPVANAIAFSPDGRRLLVGGGAAAPFGQRHPGDATVFEVATGKPILTFEAHVDIIEHLALSPDGKYLAVRCSAFPPVINVWDVSAVTGYRPARGGKGLAVTSRKPVLTEEPAGWSDLAGEDAERAYRAIWELVGRPQQSIPLLDAHLHASRKPDPQQVRRLIAGLDSDDFQTRQRSARELVELGELVAPALKAALAGKPTEEARRQLETLLGRLKQAPSRELLRALRAVEVLEHIGNEEARRVLGRLAAGEPESRLTQEAEASLRRLLNVRE
jgi:hypothetical protein